MGKMGNWFVGLWILTNLSHFWRLFAKDRGKMCSGFDVLWAPSMLFLNQQVFFPSLFISNDYDFDSYLCVHCLCCNLVLYRSGFSFFILQIRALIVVLHYGQVVLNPFYMVSATLLFFQNSVVSLGVVGYVVCFLV